MDLYVLDENLNSVSIVDSYLSLIWTDRYNKFGDFELYTSMVKGLLDNIKQDYYLWNKNSEHLMIIEKIAIDSDVEDGDTLTITGRSLESILDRRIIWNLTTLKGNLQNEIKRLLNENIISPIDEKRKINNFIFEDSTDPLITKLTIDAQYLGDNLYDVIQTICDWFEIGFKITLNAKGKFVFKLYAGVDRSYDQETNPYVVFSPTFDNLLNSNYVESKMGYKNVSLVGGEETEDGRVYIAVGDSTGLDRREVFTDASYVSSDLGNEEYLTPEEYLSVLIQKGIDDLTECSPLQFFEGQAETTVTYVYGRDFFMGDIVQVANEYGQESKSRIMEMVISENEEGLSIYPTFLTIEQEGE